MKQKEKKEIPKRFCACGCKTLFKPTHIRQIYYEKRHNPKLWIFVSEDVKCLQCGEEFETVRKKQRFCSNQCKKLWWIHNEQVHHISDKTLREMLVDAFNKGENGMHHWQDYRPICDIIIGEYLTNERSHIPK